MLRFHPSLGKQWDLLAGSRLSACPAWYTPRRPPVASLKPQDSNRCRHDSRPNLGDGTQSQDDQYNGGDDATGNHQWSQPACPRWVGSQNVYLNSSRDENAQREEPEGPRAWPPVLLPQRNDPNSGKGAHGRHHHDQVVGVIEQGHAEERPCCHHPGAPQHE